MKKYINRENKDNSMRIMIIGAIFLFLGIFLMGSVSPELLWLKNSLGGYAIIMIIAGIAGIIIGYFTRL